MNGRGFGLFDFSFLFDVLCILEIKNCKKLLRYTLVEEFKDVLIPQLGENLFNEVHKSQEYRDLYDANVLTFDMVEKADAGEVGQQQVHKTNKLRFRAKQAIQHKWFGGDMQLEVKSDRAK